MSENQQDKQTERDDDRVSAGELNEQTRCSCETSCGLGHRTKAKKTENTPETSGYKKENPDKEQLKLFYDIFILVQFYFLCLLLMCVWQAGPGSKNH